METRSKTEKRVETALRKIGFRTAAAFVVFLALAGLIWGASFALEALGFSPGSKSDALFGFFFIAVALAILSVWMEPTPVAGPGISLQVPRPKDLVGSDGVTTRERLVNLPYEITEGMVLTPGRSEHHRSAHLRNSRHNRPVDRSAGQRVDDRLARTGRSEGFRAARKCLPLARYPRRHVEGRRLTAYVRPPSACACGAGSAGVTP